MARRAAAMTNLPIPDVPHGLEYNFLMVPKYNARDESDDEGVAGEDGEEEEEEDITSSRPRPVDVPLRRNSFDKKVKTAKVEGLDSGMANMSILTLGDETDDITSRTPWSKEAAEPDAPKAAYTSGYDSAKPFSEFDPNNPGFSRDLRAEWKKATNRVAQGEGIKRWEDVPVLKYAIKGPKIVYNAIKDEIEDFKLDRLEEDELRGRAGWTGPRTLRPKMHDLEEEYTVRYGGYDRGAFEPNVHPVVLKQSAQKNKKMSLLGRLVSSEPPNVQSPQGAVKIVHIMGVKKNVRADNKKRLVQHLSAALNVESPHLLAPEAVFFEETRLAVVYPRVLGGSVFDVLKGKSRISEFSVRNIVMHVASALAAVHATKLPSGSPLAHGGVKTANILLPTKIGEGGIAQSLLGDLGVTPGGASPSNVYDCPEVLRKRMIVGGEMYSGVGAGGMEPLPDGDIWALGVTMFEMLCGYLPFQGETDEEVYRQVVDEGLRFTSSDWRHVTSECKLLIRRLLSIDPMKRPAAWEIAQDRWLDTVLEEENELEVGVRSQKTGDFKQKRQAAWKKGVRNVAKAEKNIKVAELRRTAGRVAASEEFSAVVTNSGMLLTWGRATYGELSHGEADERVAVPKMVDAGGRQVMMVALGSRHMVVLAATGEVLSCGINTSGELGHGDHKERIRLSPIPTLTGKKVALVAAGGSHSACVTTPGVLYTWGSNHHGRLGLGHTDDVSTPAVVEALETLARLGVSLGHGDGFGRVATVALGTFHTVAAMQNGGVIAWGSNKLGQCGFGEEMEESWLPEQVPISKTKDVDIVAVSAGGAHSLLLGSDGAVYSSGENSDGRLGLGHTRRAYTFERATISDDELIVGVAAGMEHSVCCSSGGQVYTCGSNSLGQLGLEDDEDRDEFTQVYALEQHNSIITLVAAGALHTIAFEVDGENGLFSWGCCDPPEVLGQLTQDDLQKMRAKFARQEAALAADEKKVGPQRTAKGMVMTQDLEALGVEMLGPGRVVVPEEIMRM
eukprot:CAMPEP_0182893354 /NCGR_PEP_ID=MMETSP0034_2-20130328/24420_1 /TAXON_ID=156128 /ORGANISM="Nephroselmis pyriformis, Strain CCMP717" /LENGTH=1011 /DNA_ID=CAMNT_0025027093 /DNA_START=51 /DNA_END=3083 /DNA_ORIENTATION=-